MTVRLSPDKMKKIYLFLFCIVLTFTFCACQSKHINLTDSEMDVMSEFVADLILKHDKNYSPTYIKTPVTEEPPTDDDTPEEEPDADITPSPVPTQLPEKETAPSANPTPTPTPTPKEEKKITVGEMVGDNDSVFIPSSEEAQDISNTNSLLSEYITNNVFNIVYNGYSLQDEVIISKSSMLQDTKDKKYLLINFSIENNGLETNTFKPIEKNFRLSVNGGRYMQPCLALTDDNMSYMSTQLQPGDTQTAILFFEVNDSDIIDTLKLMIITGNVKSEVILK